MRIPVRRHDHVVHVVVAATYGGRTFQEPNLRASIAAGYSLTGRLACGRKIKLGVYSQNKLVAQPVTCLWCAVDTDEDADVPV